MAMIKAKKCNNCGLINYANVTNCSICRADIQNATIFDYYENTQPQQPTQQPIQQYYTQQQMMMQRPMYQQPMYQQPVQKSGISALSIIGIVASCLMIIGCFMPYKLISLIGMSHSVSLIEGLTEGTSILTPLLFTLGAGTEIFNSIKCNYRALYGEGLVMVIWNIIFGMVGVSFSSPVFSDEEINNMTSYGIGYYCILIGAIALFVVGIVMKTQDND